MFTFMDWVAYWRGRYSCSSPATRVLHAQMHAEKYKGRIFCNGPITNRRVWFYKEFLLAPQPLNVACKCIASERFLHKVVATMSGRGSRLWQIRPVWPNWYIFERYWQQKKPKCLANFWGRVWKTALFKQKLQWLLFWQHLEKLGYFLFQHLVTLEEAEEK